MTKTKEKPSFQNDDENEGEDNIASIALQKPASSSVVHVEFLGKGKMNILRLDIVSVNDDDGRYSSLTYDLETADGTNGLFDFLDDFYSHRFSFFSSGKTTQAFLLALNRLEKSFYKDMCYDFRNYCEITTDISLQKVNDNSRFSDIENMRLSDGYAIGDEAFSFYQTKHSDIGIGGHIEKFGKQLRKEFNSILKEMDKSKFCCLCISNTEKIPNSFLIDPLIGLPLVVYSKEFAENLMKRNFRCFLESEVFIKAEINSISVDLWAIAPDVTVKQIMKIVGEDGELKIEYTEDAFEETDMFLGKYRTLKFNRKSYGKDYDHETVIGYN